MKTVSEEVIFLRMPFASCLVVDFSVLSSEINFRALIITSKSVFKLLHASSLADHLVILRVLIERFLEVKKILKGSSDRLKL